MKNLKVLVIDDDRTTCTLLETVLKMEGYQTGSARGIDNEDIISLLEKEKPDLVIMDFHLGSIDTLDYMAAIRANISWQHLPILMTSAIDHYKECTAAGADKFILKPFEWQTITNWANQMAHKFTTGGE